MTDFPQIPGYRIERELGRGGMATVYLAHEEKLDRSVALKVLELLSTQARDLAERFIREARTAARLQHSNIISIFDVGHFGNLNYIAMEYLPGGTLRDIVRSGSMGVGEALTIVLQLSRALGHAHSQGYIHRDIKPENVMFRRDGTVVLTDFGIARAVSEATRLTRTGMSIGTPHYMSPEQARGLALDGRADIYSLGILLYEMLTGRVPYEAEDSVAVAIKHIQEPLPELPPYLQRYQLLLDSMLAKNRENRVESAEGLSRLIEDFFPTGQGLKSDKRVLEDIDDASLHTENTTRISRTGVRLRSTKERTPAEGAFASDFGGYEERDQNKRFRSWLTFILTGALLVTIGSLLYFLNSGRIKIIDTPATTPLTKAIPQEAGGRPGQTSPSVAPQTPVRSSWQEQREIDFLKHLARARVALNSKDIEEAKRSVFLAEGINKDSPEVESIKRLIANAEAERQAETPSHEPAQRLEEKDESAWSDALKADTEKAFRDYLESWPSGRHAEEAKAKILYFRSVEMEKLVAMKQQEQEKQARADDAAWQAATGQGTEAAYENYLANYPSGRHASEAKRWLGEMRAQKQAQAREAEKQKIEEEERRKAVPTVGQIWKEPRTGIEFVWIPPGEFYMGSKTGEADELPIHTVYVDGFWMGRYEVTQGTWQSVMGSNPSYFKSGNRYPVERVSWDDTQVFIRILNSRTGQAFRLPTEAEWEYACRAGVSADHYGDLNEIAWYKRNSRGRPKEVGGKRPNAFGLYDMLGNVWEWCHDWYGKYPSGSVINPRGPSGGSARVSRGGSWDDRPSFVRAAYRGSGKPGSGFSYVGFRLVKNN